MACYQRPGPSEARSCFRQITGVLPNHSEWLSARDKGAAEVRSIIELAVKNGEKPIGGPKSRATADEAVEGLYQMYESLGIDRADAKSQPGAESLFEKLKEGKLILTRGQVYGLKHLAFLTKGKREKAEVSVPSSPDGY